MEFVENLIHQEQEKENDQRYDEDINNDSFCFFHSVLLTRRRNKQISCIKQRKHKERSKNPSERDSDIDDHLRCLRSETRRLRNVENIIDNFDHNKRNNHIDSSFLSNLHLI